MIAKYEQVNHTWIVNNNGKKVSLQHQIICHLNEACKKIDPNAKRCREHLNKERDNYKIQKLIRKARFKRKQKLTMLY